tara:strand:+ start:503 stop:1285 length:783 start_codon:yes stop_codon:yes gene_type:complete
MKNKSIEYFTSSDFSNFKILYGFFTRNGGKSKKPFDSLNCSLNPKDNKNIVIENITLAKKTIGLEKTITKITKQIHGNHIEIINNNNINREIIADGSITQTKNISLAILTADCAPIFLVDINNNLICAIHSGWKGCLNNIIFESLIKIKRINKSLKNVIAIIGPCLNQNNFEVDKSIMYKFIKKNSDYKDFFKQNVINQKLYFDMRGLINHQLKESSITNTFHVNKDTYAEKNLFFSHRRAVHNGSIFTGRMINIIGFKQ